MDAERELESPTMAGMDWESKKERKKDVVTNTLLRAQNSMRMSLTSFHFYFLARDKLPLGGCCVLFSLCVRFSFLFTFKHFQKFNNLQKSYACVCGVCGVCGLWNARCRKKLVHKWKKNRFDIFNKHIKYLIK